MPDFAFFSLAGLSFLAKHYPSPSKTIICKGLNKNISTSATVSKSIGDSGCDQMLQCSQKQVTFHPSVVTNVHIRPPTPQKEKSNLYFSRLELQKCREEEKSKTVQRQSLTAIIEAQQKYQKCQGKRGQKGTITMVKIRYGAPQHCS